MASSGTISNAIRTGYAIRIAWTVTSQDIANNTSTVTANVQLVSTGSSYTINSSATKDGSLTVNGTKYTFTFNASLSGNQTKTIFTKTGVVIPHSSDGTKTCAFSCSAGINVTLGGTYYGNVNASGTGVFNTIARASTISSVTASVAVNGTNTCVVNISRKNASFTHTVVWKIGSYSKTTTGVGTSTSYAIPMSWLAAIPEATSGTATVQVTTYNGSTKIGSTVSTTFKITVPATVVPTFSSVAVADTETAVYNFFGNMVQNKSRAKLTITAAGAYGSTIKTYKTVFESKNYSGATPTTSVITKSGTATATITITDSRGRTASTTKAWTVVAYTAPKITDFYGARCLADGTENYEGTYIKVSMNYAISSVSNKNTASYVIEYKLQTATTWTKLTEGTGYAVNTSLISSSGFFNANNSYDIRLSITDYFGTIRKTFEIPTAFTLIDFNKSGRGLAFGKVSEKAEGVEFGMPAYFSNSETPSSMTFLTEGQDFNNILEAGFYAIPTTAISGTLLNKPWTSTATGSLIVLREGNGVQKCQIAHKGSKEDGAIYERAYYGNTWGEWHKVYCGEGTILWSGSMYMNASQTITLSEPVSKQASGIVLIFSRYSASTAQNYHWNSFFIHKAWVKAHASQGHTFILTTDGKFSVIASKYLYIHDDKIGGNANNEATGTANGITFNNAGFVLRYVIGV